jgi:hypothetical protein
VRVRVKARREAQAAIWVQESARASEGEEGDLGTCSDLGAEGGAG